MTNEEIIQHYDYLIRLATAKCNAQTDAEDLVGDTMLAAFAYIHKGGTIEHPRTWLVNTLYHKYNDKLRKKYRTPITVCLDEILAIAEDDDDWFLATEEAKKVRKELNHLGYITREVLIRYYYRNQNVAEIAKGLAIPEGTVKSRLFAGRNQIKKGLETMEARENCLAGRLSLSCGGSTGLNGEPMSLVNDDLIAQNLLMLAYKKPASISTLSKAIGIPAVYIEPIIKKLVDSELMVQTDNGNVYADFIIIKPQNILKNFKAQQNFAHKHFEVIWNTIQNMSNRIRKLPFVQSFGTEEQTKLDRYAVLKALQDFVFRGANKFEMPCFPKRKDGGRWFANAIAFDADYNTKDYESSVEYIIHGGHRRSQKLSVGRAKQIYFYEFDTTLWDSPHRYGGAYELYFDHITSLLWHIYEGDSLENTDIPNEFISYMPTLETCGLIGYTQDKPFLKVPVLQQAEYAELNAIIQSATAEITYAIGEDFATLITSMKTPIPKHLTSVPELFKYIEATSYIAMSVVREAYNKGLHLKDVDYCCPPVVLVYELCEA